METLPPCIGTKTTKKSYAYLYISIDICVQIYIYIYTYTSVLLCIYMHKSKVDLMLSECYSEVDLVRSYIYNTISSWYCGNNSTIAIPKIVQILTQMTVCMHIYIYMCIHIYILTDITKTCTYIYTCAYIYMYMCIHIYMYSLTIQIQHSNSTYIYMCIYIYTNRY